MGFLSHVLRRMEKLQSFIDSRDQPYNKHIWTREKCWYVFRLKYYRNKLVPLLTANNEQIHMQFSRLVSIDQLILGVSQTIDIWSQDAT